jgi:hypothetical protein
MLGQSRMTPASVASEKLRSDVDWAGRWFDLVEELQGEFVGMRGGLLKPDGSVSWTFVPHARFDGLGGFVDLLRRTTAAKDLPVPVRRSQRPSLRQRIVAVARLCSERPRPAGRWRCQDPSYRPGEVRYREGSTSSATHLFTTEETRALAQTAHANGAPLNALLLSALARATELEIVDGPAIWMMPVNMRGPVSLPRDTANHTGYLQIDISQGASAAHVQAAVKERLRRREHWGSWLFLNLGRVLGYRGMRAIYRFQMRRYRSRPFTGSFSNLGSWRDVGYWFVCPPVTMNAPIAAGAIVCDGRLSLTLEAHASISGGSKWSDATLRRWIAILRTN